jgi:hypothetical protein
MPYSCLCVEKKMKKNVSPSSLYSSSVDSLKFLASLGTSGLLAK